MAFARCEYGSELLHTFAVSVVGDLGSTVGGTGEHVWIQSFFFLLQLNTLQSKLPGYTLQLVQLNILSEASIKDKVYSTFTKVRPAPPAYLYLVSTSQIEKEFLHGISLFLVNVPPPRPLTRWYCWTPPRRITDDQALIYTARKTSRRVIQLRVLHTHTHTYTPRKSTLLQ